MPAGFGSLIRRVKFGASSVLPVTSGLTARWQASGIATGSGYVTTWTDSVASNVASAQVGSNLVTTTSPRGKTGVRFNGADWLQFTELTSGTYATAYTTSIAIIRTTQNNTTPGDAYEPPVSIVCDNISNENQHLGLNGAHASWDEYAGGQQFIVGSVTVNDGNIHVIGGTWDSSGGSGACVSTLYVDGSVDGTTLTGRSFANQPGIQKIGSGKNSTTKYVGDVFEVLNYSRALTSTEMASIGSWAAANY